MRGRTLVAFWVASSVSSVGMADSPRQKTYICRRGSVIWNQSVPCDKHAPEQEILQKQLRTQPDPPKNMVPGDTIEEPSAVEASLMQVTKFPGEYEWKNVTIHGAKLRGNFWPHVPNLPEGRRSVAVLEDADGQTVAATCHDSWAHRYSGELSARLAYPLETITLEVQPQSDGSFVLFIAGLKFRTEESPTPYKLDPKTIPNPFLGRPTEEGIPDDSPPVRKVISKDPAPPQPLSPPQNPPSRSMEEMQEMFEQLKKQPPGEQVEKPKMGFQ